MKLPEHELIWKEYEKALDFNAAIGLNETVRTNENFFIGKQWEGVEANGLPTPVFNFLKRVVLFTVSGLSSGSIKMAAAPMDGETKRSGLIADVVNDEFVRLFESNKIGALIRQFMRNAAVDGDSCLYTYWDPDAVSGHPVSGAIVTEVVENNRVFFGNPNDRRVEKQPYIIISSREPVSDVRKRALRSGQPGCELISPDEDERGIDSAHMTDDKVTVLLKLWRDADTGKIWACESAKTAVIREPFSTGLSLYPVTWLNWDYIQDCYHGQAMITGLIPNQIFINKLFAMSMISLMTTAYPKVLYDKTRIARWDNRVGAAIPIAGGDVHSVARIMDPAAISPQIAQFIDLSVGYTQTFLGATSAALGDVRPDNTSAIIALQKASALPNELIQQNLYQCIEDLGRVYLDFMGEYYGTREVYTHHAEAGEGAWREFDFRSLRDARLSLRLDVGASSYWSEIASIQTLDNLMISGKLDLVDYLERIPNGYIAKKQELLDKLRDREKPQADPGATGQTGPLQIESLFPPRAGNPLTQLNQAE